jgi:hypothetical protein
MRITLTEQLSLTPSPGTPGEGWGGGLAEIVNDE